MSPHKKRPGFVRTTISLPAELRRRMKACGESVNWSAVAAEAFASKVARINAEKDDLRFDDVVARLRSSLNVSWSEMFERGRLQGEKWAKHQATARQLQDLWAKRRDAKSKGGARYDNWLSVIDDKRPPAEVLRMIIAVNHTPRPGSEGEALMKSSEFVHGFAAGAIHVWKQVARKLRGEL